MSYALRRQSKNNRALVSAEPDVHRIDAESLKIDVYFCAAWSAFEILEYLLVAHDLPPQSL